VNLDRVYPAQSLGAVYRIILLIPSNYLPSIAGIVDRFGRDAKLFAEFFHQHLYSLYLAIRWAGGFSVSYNADANSLTAAVRGSAWYDRPLSLPFFGWLYLAVAATMTVA